MRYKINSLYHYDLRQRLWATSSWFNFPQSRPALYIESKYSTGEALLIAGLGSMGLLIGIAAFELLIK